MQCQCFMSKSSFSPGFHLQNRANAPYSAHDGSSALWLPPGFARVVLLNVTMSVIHMRLLLQIKTSLLVVRRIAATVSPGER